MPKHIKGRGPMDARLLILGEAPGRREEEQGNVFVGQSGVLQDRWIRNSGIDPKSVRIDNVVTYKPPGPNIQSIPYDELRHYIDEDLPKRLAQLTNLSLIVPVGNTALSALLPNLVRPRPLKSGRWEFSKPGITVYRGSIYEALVLNLRGNPRLIKVIPTIHPAAILYSAGGPQREEDEQGFRQTVSWEKRCRADWLRIARELEFPEVNLPSRFHHCSPTGDQIARFYESLQNGSILAIDIETNPREGKILCVGFAAKQDYSITIPWKTRWQKEWIAALCEHPCKKALHNGHYDAYWLAQKGSRVRNYYYDTLNMHHALDPLDEHSLHYLASLFTDEPYWKAEGKFETPGGETYRDFSRLMQYCGKDACVTRELVTTLEKKLREEDKWEYYIYQYAEMHKPILETMLHGVQVDQEEMTRMGSQLEEDQLRLRDELARLNEGEPLFKLTTKRDQAIHALLGYFPHGPKQLLEFFKYINSKDLPDEQHEDAMDAFRPEQGMYDLARKSKTKFYSEEEVRKSLETIAGKKVSNQELMKCLYEKHKLPIKLRRRKDTGKKTPTVDAIALRKLRGPASRKEGPALAILDKAIEYAKVRKRAEFYDLKGVDEDGRLRCTYKLGGTETGRLSSSKNPRGTGTNLQNRSRSDRAIFVPDPGCVFLEIDLSQAEDRVVKALAYSVTGNKDLLARARAMPWENDEHKRAARAIFLVALEDVTDKQRQVSKTIRHGLNYDMQEVTMSRTLLLEDHVYTPEECKRMMRSLAQEEPEVKAWQEWTQRKIIRQRKLVDSWGGEFHVPYERFDPHLYRRAYARIPQGEVGKLLNMYGFKPLAKRIRQGHLLGKINLQVHDSLVVSCPPGDVWNVASFLREHLEQSRFYNGVELSIPCEYALGYNWNKKEEMHEWKALPCREEMTAVAYSMLEKGKEKTLGTS